MGITLRRDADPPSGLNYPVAAQSYVYHRGDRTQTLTTGPGPGSALFLEATGDFDGDGRPDFILSYHAATDDLMNYYVLWLSSRAKPGELPGPAAPFSEYFGC